MAKGRTTDSAFTALVADDEHEWRKSLEKLFVVKGFRVSSASTIDELLAAVRRSRFDVIVVDLRMPEGQNGRAQNDAGLVAAQLLQRFAVDTRDSIVVVFTAFPSVCDCFAAIDARAYYMPKVLPGKINVSEQLVAECHRLLESRRTRANGNRQTWLSAHYDELVKRFPGRTVAIVGSDEAKRIKGRSGVSIGDCVVFTDRNAKRLQDRILDDPEFRRALPVVLNVLD